MSYLIITLQYFIIIFNSLPIKKYFLLKWSFAEEKQENNSYEKLEMGILADLKVKRSADHV